MSDFCYQCDNCGRLTKDGVFYDKKVVCRRCKEEIVLDLHNKTEQAKIDYANACILFNEIQRIKRSKLKALIIAQNNELKGGE